MIQHTQCKILRLAPFELRDKEPQSERYCPIRRHQLPRPSLARRRRQVSTSSMLARFGQLPDYDSGWPAGNRSSSRKALFLGWRLGCRQWFAHSGASHYSSQAEDGEAGLRAARSQLSRAGAGDDVVTSRPLASIECRLAGPCTIPRIMIPTRQDEVKSQVESRISQYQIWYLESSIHEN
ncbi:hypothetical protein CC79DRAFT_462334 [Sarocladium strictum]